MTKLREIATVSRGAPVLWGLAVALGVSSVATHRAQAQELEQEQEQESAQVPKVAVVKVIGPRRARPRKVQRGILKALRRAGFRVVTPRRLARAARRARVSPDNVVAAASVKADYLLVTQIVRNRRRVNTVSVDLVDVKSDETRETLSATYRKRKRAYATGKRLAREVTAVIEELQESSPPVPEPPPPPEEALLAENLVAETVDPFGPVGDAPAGFDPVEPPPIREEEPQEEPPEPLPIVRPQIDVQSDRPTPERRNVREESTVRLGAFAGAQVATNYTVEVGGEVTQLSYRLAPLLLVGAEMAIRPPGIGFGFDATFYFSPANYQVNVTPELPVTEPTAQFISASGAVSWALTLSRFGQGGGIWLAPLAGLDYSTLSAESQGESSVLLSWSAIDVHLGGRLSIRPSGSFAFDVDGRVGSIVSFSESPKNTGENGGGMSLQVGGQMRFWLADGFALSLRAGFRRQDVSLSSSGNRTPFIRDPDLVGAGIVSSDFKVGAGAQVAF